MKLNVWDEMEVLERHLDDLTRSVLRPRAGLIHPVLPLFVRRPFVPAIDVFARGDDMVVRVELPGIDPATDVTVAVEDGELVVRGERKEQEDVHQEAYYRMEAAFGTFERRIRMPQSNPFLPPPFRLRRAIAFASMTLAASQWTGSEASPGNMRHRALF